jgi:putative endopeptidase
VRLEKTAFLLLGCWLLWCPCAAGQMEPKLEHFDPNQADRSLEPCEDFYRFACNKWFKANPMPPDQVRWGTDSGLETWNEKVLQETLENSAGPSPNRSAVQQKIGDFWAACMDEKGIDAAGTRDLAPELRRIDALADKRDLTEIIAHLHMTLPGAWEPSLSVNQMPAAFFGFGSKSDLDNASLVIVVLDQGGMGLPGRDFYLKDDAKSAEIRSKYQAHIAKMLLLSGESEAAAGKDAATILALETGLAKAAMDNVSRRDPKNINNKMSLEELQELTPSIEWKRYIAAVGAPPPHHYLVRPPAFFKGLEALIEQHPLQDWKAYLRWHLVHSSAPYLAKAFDGENFDFYQKTLAGVQQQLPRWRRCVRSADRFLGEALGQAYVERAFSPERKRKAVEMVQEVEAALEHDIESLDWMTPATKKEAQKKLRMMEAKVGYPNQWRDYSPVKIGRDSYLCNVHEATGFEFRRLLTKVAKPVDRAEWRMTPPTINAYYDTQLNTINFPAGILQPPFFDDNVDVAANYGATGGIVGHEIIHGFDDRGRKFDASGNLRDWWTAEDANAYVERGKCISDEYTQEVPEAGPGVKQDGHLTQGEDTADNGGTRLAFMAFEARSKRDGVSLDEKSGDGWTARQRFFLSYANSWCSAERPDAIRTRVLTNQHSYAPYRVNNVVSNMPEFWQAFGCKKGQRMVRDNACRVW